VNEAQQREHERLYMDMSDEAERGFNVALDALEDVASGGWRMQQYPSSDQVAAAEVLLGLTANLHDSPQYVGEYLLRRAERRRERNEKRRQETAA
jgi:hypothetical protein